MLKTFLYVLFSSFLIVIGCSDDDPVTPNSPTGEVLLATVAGDSVSTSTGFAARTNSISSSSLNFSDRDSARISFFYSGTPTNQTTPFKILITGTDDSVYWNNSLNQDSTEKFIDVTIPSNHINNFLSYRISVLTNSGHCYFKFRDLKIYKK